MYREYTNKKRIAESEGRKIKLQHPQDKPKVIIRKPATKSISEVGEVKLVEVETNERANNTNDHVKEIAKYSNRPINTNRLVSSIFNLRQVTNN